LATALRTTVRRRRVKISGGHLGPLLCWAVVFADIGTSIYYVPGILSASGFNKRSEIFVLMTLVVFIFLSIKYAEVTWRNPEGGGVVTISSKVLHPFVGLVGGLFIIVDYYLTAALSAYSGINYLAVVVPPVAVANAVPGTLLALGGLAVLNIIGIRESAVVSFVAAALAAAGQLLVVIVVAVALGPAGVVHSFSAIGQGPPPITPVIMITGFGAAFLAFSGLESVAQLAPAMRQPRQRVAYRTMALVILTMALTSPLLTLWQTILVPDPNSQDNVNQLLSLLGGRYAGVFVADYVAVTGAVLLIFASNTAIIGGYHVFLALTRMGFLPRVIERYNSWRRTPHIAVVAAVAPPTVLVYLAGLSAAANVFLGDLYAFGLLGSFILTNVSLDVLRWRELRHLRSRRKQVVFAVGVLTTLAVCVGWGVNLVAKPYATIFGGSLTVIGVCVGLATYRHNHKRRPAVFPVPYERTARSIEETFRRRPADVLVLLPHEPAEAEAVIEEGIRAAHGKSAVFLYRGGRDHHDTGDIFEVNDPYLRDYHAQDALARAESLARKKLHDRRYVYVPRRHQREVLADVWRAIHPRETVAAEADHELLPPIALERIRRHRVNGQVVLHMVTGRQLREAASA
jgi:amino acid transporter